MKNKKFKRRIKRHIQLVGPLYLRISLVVVLVVFAIWGAKQMTVKEGEHDEVVKALTGTQEERFQIGKDKAAEGEMAEARTVMLRLARLGDSTDRPVGYGPAHLWVAQDILKNFKTGFIYEFPYSSDGVGSADGLKSTNTATSVLMGDGDEVFRAQRHLGYAVALSPELKDASVLLAASYAAQQKRNLAVDVLLNAITHAKHPHPPLHVPLVNVLTMAGDDLALQERAWHVFSSLGDTVGGGHDLTSRVRYVMSALFLKKDNNADIAIRRLEAASKPLENVGGGVSRKIEGWKDDLASSGRDGASEVSEAKQVRALRMAYHYHRAIRFYLPSKAGAKVNHAVVVDELERVIGIQSDCVAAVDCLSLIASENAELKPRVQAILQKVLLQKQKEDEAGGQMTSDVSVSLALLDDATDPLAKKKYLEQAVQADPNNEEALVRLAQILAADPQITASDYDRIYELAQRALKQDSLQQHAVLLAECYAVLGQVYVKQQQWPKAIVALERSLAELKDKKALIILLIEAYTATGQTKMVEALEGSLEVEKN